LKGYLILIRFVAGKWILTLLSIQLPHSVYTSKVSKVSVRCPYRWHTEIPTCFFCTCQWFTDPVSW